MGCWEGQGLGTEDRGKLIVSPVEVVSAALLCSTEIVGICGSKRRDKKTQRTRKPLSLWSLWNRVETLDKSALEFDSQCPSNEMGKLYKSDRED